MHHFFAVPGFAGADADEAADAEDIVSKSLGELFVGGVPFAGVEFESGCAFGVHVDGLFLIEVDAVRHQFGLESYAVVVHLVV